MKGRVDLSKQSFTERAQSKDLFQLIHKADPAAACRPTEDAQSATRKASLIASHYVKTDHHFAPSLSNDLQPRM